MTKGLILRAKELDFCLVGRREPLRIFKSENIVLEVSRSVFFFVFYHKYLRKLWKVSSVYCRVNQRIHSPTQIPLVTLDPRLINRENESLL